MRKIEFLNNVHRVGEQNVTVRLGEKWADLRVGERVLLVETGRQNGRKAQVEVVERCLMRDVRQYILAREHDPQCYTLEGLMAAMKRAYGDKVSWDSAVTCIVYVPE